MMRANGWPPLVRQMLEPAAYPHDVGEIQLVETHISWVWGSAQAIIEGPRGSLAISIEDAEHLGHGRVELTVEDSPVGGSLVAFPTDGTVRKVRARLIPDSPREPPPT